MSTFLLLQSTTSTSPATSDPSDRTGESANLPQAASSSAGMAVGITAGCIIAIIVAVALVLHFRNRRKRHFEKNCSVVMTRMYPDVTVNANISFQKFT